MVGVGTPLMRLSSERRMNPLVPGCAPVPQQDPGVHVGELSCCGV